MAEAVAPATRGKLKIFFGAFPGAGKTDAMLAAARRMREAGRDVVIGVIDMHGKPEEAAATAGFEGVGSAPHGELALDAILARRPQVVLIDDLAHSNPPGSRHPKRWSDVDEILAAGIDVFTSMSVQHLASLNDVVAEITGQAEPETVPDSFFDSAEETVMVDMSADELLVRFGAGLVPVQHVRLPEARFFSKGTLLALREIALRRVADVVEDEVRRYRAEKHIGATWKTHGRLLCCIGPQAGAEHVVRSAARLAAQLDEKWTAVYVETPALQRLPAAERARILRVVSLAHELGADTAILTGNDVSEALVEYAQDQNISTVVVGHHTPRRFRFVRSMSDQIARASDRFDVIEIGRAGGGAEAPAPASSFKRPEVSPERRVEKRVRYLWTLLACAFATLVLTLLTPAFDLANVVMLYMLTVVMVGVRWGRGPAILAALLNVVAFDFFFVPPRFSLVPHDIQYYLTFAVMLAVGVITGQLAGGIRFQAKVASHREKRARMLYEFARDLAQLQTTSDVIRHTEGALARHLGARVAVLVPDATGSLVSPTSHGMTNPFDSTTAQWAYDQGRPAGAGTDTLGTNEHVFLPLRSPTRIRGVLAIRPERTRDLLIPEQRHQFDIFAALVATALERVHYVDVARDALLMARIHSGDLQLEPERRALPEVVQAARVSLGAVLASHPVTLDFPADLPQVPVDSKLIERVFASLLGNVAKHTPATTPLRVAARANGEQVETIVEDQGPGLPAGREDQVFESFERGEGAMSGRKGAGLGLAISRAIVEAHGGSLHAERCEGRGARFVVTLPLRIAA